MGALRTLVLSILVLVCLSWSGIDPVVGQAVTQPAFPQDDEGRAGQYLVITPENVHQLRRVPSELLFEGCIRGTNGGRESVRDAVLMYGHEVALNSDITLNPDRSLVTFVVAFVEGDSRADTPTNHVAVYQLPSFQPLDVTFPLPSQVWESQLALTNLAQDCLAIGLNNGVTQIYQVSTGVLMLTIPPTPATPYFVQTAPQLTPDPPLLPPATLTMRWHFHLMATTYM